MRVAKTILALSLILIPNLLGGTPAMAIEEPKFEKVGEYEAFELRKYAPFIIAETTVTEDFDEAGTRAFKRLGGYIFGNNARSDKLEMTAPVTTEPAGVDNGKNRWRISFVMPSKFSLQALPLPNDATVTHRQVEEQVVAANRFSGTWNEDRFKEKGQELLAAVRAQGLNPKEETLRYARYNAPWTPWFLRRNEVLVDINIKPVLSAPKPQAPAPDSKPRR